MPKIVDREQYRKELLDKCFELFADKGYAAITMRQIAEGLGVSTGTLYHYFPNKKELFEQLVEQMSQQDILMAAAELTEEQTLIERVETLGKFLTKNEEYFVKQSAILLDFSQHTNAEEIQHDSVLAKADDRYKQGLKEMLGIEDPTVIQFILCFINGLIVERLCGNEEVSFSEQVSLLGKMLVAYLNQ